MKHLSASELVDLAEGALDGARAAHAHRCDACRAAASEIRETLQRASAAAPTADPSPLFWDHFSARVREAVASEQPGGQARWAANLRAFLPVAAAAVLVLVVSVSIATRRHPVSDGVTFAGAAPALAGEAATDFDATIDPESREVWQVLTAAAADLELDDAHAAGMSVQPAAIDRAVQRLNADELNELGRLLQSELKRAGN